MSANNTNTATSGTIAIPNVAGQPNCSAMRGAKQRGQQRAGVAGTGNAHRQALIFRWVPAARQRQRDRETGAGNAEEEARARRSARCVVRELPARDQRQQRQRQTEHPGAPPADALAEHAEQRPEQRAAQQRNRRDESLLGRRQPEVFAQKRRERPEQHPRHEADVEVEQRGDERRRVPGAKEPSHATCSFRARACTAAPRTITPSSTRTG